MELYGVCSFVEASFVQPFFEDLFALLCVSVVCSFSLLNAFTRYEYISVLFIQPFLGGLLDCF